MIRFLALGIIRKSHRLIDAHMLGHLIFDMQDTLTTGQRELYEHQDIEVITETPDAYIIEHVEVMRRAE